MIVSPGALELVRLREYPFLKPLPDGLLNKMVPHLTERTFAAGETLLRTGEYSDSAYYLAQGAVELRFAPARGAAAGPTRAKRSRDDISRMETVQLGGVAADGTVVLSDMPVNAVPQGPVVLEAGELFGEINALARYPISTDVIARTDVTCLIIRTPALRLLFKQQAIAWFKEQVDAKYRSRTLAQHLRQVDLFAELSDGAIERLRQDAELLTYEPGKRIVAQDDAADALFLVRGGHVKVSVQVGRRDLAISYLRKGDFAGEVALLVNQVWPVSLDALEYVELVKISRAVFERILQTEPAVERRVWETIVDRLKQRGAAIRNPIGSQYLQMAMDTGLIHGESVLLIDLNTCTRCDDCVRACADAHNGLPRFVREDHLLRDGGRYKHWMVPQACYQCTDPACLVGCPTGAITRPLGTLQVTIDPATCIGCGNCVRRCPWDNIVAVPFPEPKRADVVGDLATKCDLCVGRASGPACVQMCPHGSAVRISFKDLTRVVETLRN